MGDDERRMEDSSGFRSKASTVTSPARTPKRSRSNERPASYSSTLLPKRKQGLAFSIPTVTPPRPSLRSGKTVVPQDSRPSKFNRLATVSAESTVDDASFTSHESSSPKFVSLEDSDDLAKMSGLVMSPSAEERSEDLSFATAVNISASSHSTVNATIPLDKSTSGTESPRERFGSPVKSATSRSTTDAEAQQQTLSESDSDEDVKPPSVPKKSPSMPDLVVPSKELFVDYADASLPPPRNLIDNKFNEQTVSSGSDAAVSAASSVQNISHTQVDAHSVLFRLDAAGHSSQECSLSEESDECFSTDSAQLVRLHDEITIQNTKKNRSNRSEQEMEKDAMRYLVEDMNANVYYGEDEFGYVDNDDEDTPDIIIRNGSGRVISVNKDKLAFLLLLDNPLNLLIEHSVIRNIERETDEYHSHRHHVGLLRAKYSWEKVIRSEYRKHKGYPFGLVSRLASVPRGLRQPVLNGLKPKGILKGVKSNDSPKEDEATLRNSSKRVSFDAETTDTQEITKCESAIESGSVSTDGTSEKEGKFFCFDPSTELISLMQSGEFELGDVEDLLRAGASSNVQNARGATPLHFAVWKEEEKIVDFLLENGAFVNALDEDYFSPLHLAALAGNHEISLLLLANGASPHLRTYPLPSDRSYVGKTAMEIFGIGQNTDNEACNMVIELSSERVSSNVFGNGHVFLGYPYIFGDDVLPAGKQLKVLNRQEDSVLCEWENEEAADGRTGRGEIPFAFLSLSPPILESQEVCGMIFSMSYKRYEVEKAIVKGLSEGGTDLCGIMVAARTANAGIPNIPHPDNRPIFTREMADLLDGDELPHYATLDTEQVDIDTTRVLKFVCSLKEFLDHDPESLENQLKMLATRCENILSADSLGDFTQQSFDVHFEAGQDELSEPAAPKPSLI